MSPFATPQTGSFSVPPPCRRRRRAPHGTVRSALRVTTRLALEWSASSPDTWEDVDSSLMRRRPALFGRRPVFGSRSPSRPSRRRGVCRMSEDDVLFGYRLRVFDAAPDRVSGPAGCSGSIARPTTRGSAGGAAWAWGSCAEERRRPRMPNQFRRLWRSGSSPSRSAIPVSDRGGSPASLRGSAGAGSSSGITASGAACAATGSTRARSGSRSSPATRPLPAAARARAGAPRRGPPARRAGRPRLLLRRPPVRHQGLGLAVDRDRRRLRLRLGRARQLPARQPDRAQTSKLARARRRRLRRRLAARARAHRQRRRVRATLRATLAGSAPATP